MHLSKVSKNSTKPKNVKHFLPFLGLIITVDLDNKGVELGKGFECVD